MISRVWGNHQKIFDFLLREEDEVVTLVLFLFNIFLLVVAVMSLVAHFYLAFCTDYLSKQQYCLVSFVQWWIEHDPKWLLSSYMFVSKPS